MKPSFELSSDERRHLGYLLIDRINDYFASLPDRPVQLPLEERTFGELHNALPEIGTAAEKVLDEVCREMVDKGFHVPSANYFGLMNPTPTYVGVLAEALVAALNPQLATMARSQLASKIEHETVRWIAERIGWTSQYGGTFTSGGNEANFSALALALAWKFPQAMEEGIASISAQPVLYASAESHHSLDKSAGLLGLGRRALRRIATTERVQLTVSELVRQIEADIAAGHRPFCVIGTAGTTNSGAIDDITALAEICRRYDLWLHVDGAYGASAVFSDKHRDLVRGIELADSVTVDPHKWLAMPFAAGVVVTRNPQALNTAFEVNTPYMPRAQGAMLVDNFKISTQWSRRMNSLKLWLTLRIHGRQAYEEHIDRQMQLASNFAEHIKGSKHFGLAVPWAVPILNVRVKKPDASPAELAEIHNRIVHEVTRSGERWISETRVAGQSVIRIMIISYLTEQRHLDDLLAAMESGAAANF